MKFLCLLLISSAVGASVSLSIEDFARLEVGDPPAFLHALDVLEGRNLSRYYLHGQLPGASGEIPDVFHLVARLNSLEVTQLFLRVAIQDPRLGFWLIAGLDKAGPDHFFSLGVMTELVPFTPDTPAVLKALNRVLSAYESAGQIAPAVVARFDRHVFNRLGRLLGRLSHAQQDEFAQHLSLHKKSLDDDFHFRLQSALRLADHFRCVITLAQ